MQSDFLNHPLTRRGALGALAAAVVVPVSACGSSTPPGAASASSGTISGSAYDTVIAAGPIAAAKTVSGNAWAAKIRKAGVLKRGGTDTAALFSLKNPTTGKITGFDAGIGDLLARYIIGAKGKTDLTQTSVDTRETLLVNNSVDVVIATYSITTERAEKVAFAGPYYSSGDSVMIKKTTKGISSVKDLAGKNVATQANSTGVTALEQAAPDAKVQAFTDDASCVAALQQGRVDAYVIDEAILLSDAVTNSDFTVVGKPFTTDAYGIGVTKSDSGAKEFVNAFLTAIEKDGTWAKLWKATVGTVVTGDAPTPPKLGSVDGS